MLKRKSLFVLEILSLALLLSGCGKKEVPQFNSPADGTTYQLQGNQMQVFNVTLADNDYKDTTIQIKGSLPSSNQVQCSGGNGTYMVCYIQSGNSMQQASGMLSNLTGQRYTVVFQAVRGDSTADVIVNFDYGTVQR